MSWGPPSWGKRICDIRGWDLELQAWVLKDLDLGGTEPRVMAWRPEGPLIPRWVWGPGTVVTTPFSWFYFLFRNPSSPETGVLHLVVMKDFQALPPPGSEMSQILRPGARPGNFQKVYTGHGIVGIT